ncbi:MAG: hypothetical protein ACXW0G_02705 [Methylosarcina sp.]
MHLTSEDIKRLNLKILIADAGGPTKLAELVDTNQAYISQLTRVKKPRNIGPKLARRLEEVFNKPIGWMDVLHLLDIDEKIPNEELADPALVMIKEHLLHDYRINPRKLSFIKWSQIDILRSFDQLQDFISMIIDSTNLDGNLPENSFVIEIDDDSFKDHFRPGTKIIFDPNQSPKCGETILIEFKENAHKTIARYRPTPKGVYYELLEAGYPKTIEADENDIIIHGVALVETWSRRLSAKG